MLGLGLEHLGPLQAASRPRTRSVIFIFLSGGLAQQDSFDLKPDAAVEFRGEFKPISTRTPGIQICEHLPRLAERSSKWSLVRSLTHPSNDHSAGHHIMLTGQSKLPVGFDASKPKPSDHPCIASIVGAAIPPRNNLPPAIVLPEKLIHNSGRVIPGQFAGVMGRQRDPWFLESSAFEPKAYGAYPEYEFDHQQRKYSPRRSRFQLPNLSLPEGVDQSRFDARLDILKQIDEQRAQLDQYADDTSLTGSRANAVALLMDRQVRSAFDLSRATPRDLDRYGQNSFGWSLLMASRLVEAGVSLVQVNLGNNETWDTHGNAFPHLKDKLFPPTDRALSALLDDLSERGLLDSTLIVMAGEFGRTPRISTLPSHYKLPGRDHWGAVQSIWLAGGGIQSGRVIGSSDAKGGFPATDPQTPENFAATIYHSLGIPKTASWTDAENRPHFLYHGEPIRGLS